jgi:hypothetical protein
MLDYNLEEIVLAILTEMWLRYDEIKSGGLHNKHAVATWKWEAYQYLLKGRGKPRKPVSRRPVAGTSVFMLPSGQHSGKQYEKEILKGSDTHNYWGFWTFHIVRYCRE